MMPVSINDSGFSAINSFQTGSVMERQVFQAKSLIVPDKATMAEMLMNNLNVVAYRDASSLRRLTENSCSYAFISGIKRMDILGIYLQKNSSFVDVFNQQLSNKHPDQSYDMFNNFLVTIGLLR